MFILEKIPDPLSGNQHRHSWVRQTPVDSDSKMLIALAFLLGFIIIQSTFPHPSPVRASSETCLNSFVRMWLLHQQHELKQQILKQRLMA